MNFFRSIFISAFALAVSACANCTKKKSCCVAQAAPAQKPAARVAVFLPKLDGKTRYVAWTPNLTIDEAITTAAGGSNYRWNEAWRLRKTRALFSSGEKNPDVLFLTRSDAKKTKSLLKPGDQVTVDLAPID